MADLNARRFGAYCPGATMIGISGILMHALGAARTSGKLPPAASARLLTAILSVLIGLLLVLAVLTLARWLFRTRAHRPRTSTPASSQRSPGPWEVAGKRAAPIPGGEALRDRADEDGDGPPDDAPPRGRL